MTANPFSRWCWVMAWRDGRRDFRRLALFASATAFGIAALVAVGSLRDDLEGAVGSYGKSLLGADLMLSSRRPFPPDVESALAGLQGRRADEVSFMTMARVPSTGTTRLVQVRALEAPFPFYGEPVTDPPDAWGDCLAGRGVLLEESVLGQLGVTPGDTVAIGGTELPVLGHVIQAPPRASAFSAFAPQAFIAHPLAAQSGLLGDRSLAFYRSYFAFEPGGATAPDGDPVAAAVEPIRELLSEHGIRRETVERRQRNLGRALDNLYSFFGLTAFVALVLGGIGIASAVHVHVLQRSPSVATLRCLGCPAGSALGVYLIQGLALGAFGVLAGTALGIALQFGAVAAFRGHLPVPLQAHVSLPAIAWAAAIGFLLSFCFTLLPLLRVRRVPPLAALRADVSGSATAWRDPAFWAAAAAVTTTLAAAGWALSPPREPALGIAFAAGLAAALAALAGVARLTTAAARLFLHPALPYPVRQGIANLYRPRNQTLLFLVSAGLVSAVVMTLNYTHRLVLDHLRTTAGQDKPNLFVIDVQAHHRGAVEDAISSLGLDVSGAAPIIPMSLAAINGTPVRDLQSSRDTRLPGWVVRRDFRSTYRQELTANESLTSGRWIPTFEPDSPDTPIPASLEEGIAREMKVGLGDTFTMDVQGLPVDFLVTSFREVDWESLDLNFFLVFPAGPLDTVPASWVISTRTPDPATSATLQNTLARDFPSTTVFDVTLILQTITSIVGAVSTTIRFMSLFTTAAGATILTATLLSTINQRLAESVLLRTLGASKRQVWTITTVEFFSLGTLAALTGASLATAATHSLASRVFHVPFLSHASPLLTTTASVLTLTLTLGLLLSRHITSTPPLTTLRNTT